MAMAQMARLIDAAESDDVLLGKLKSVLGDLGGDTE
jgi:hypothetical protein